MGGNPLGAKQRTHEWKDNGMDFGGFNWTLLTIIGPLVLAVVIIVAVLRNRVSSDVAEKSERATRDLYREEDRAHRDDDDEGRI